jgi:hypothetical protein
VAVIGWRPWVLRPNDVHSTCINDVPPVKNIANGLPVDLLQGPAIATAERAAALQQSSLVELAEEACAIAREPEAARIAAVLTKRCRLAKTLTLRYLTAIGEVR